MQEFIRSFSDYQNEASSSLFEKKIKALWLVLPQMRVVKDTLST